MKRPCLVEKNTNKQVAVVSAGAIVSQIAMVYVLAGNQVTLQDIEQHRIDKEEALIDGQMDRWVEKGRFTREEVDSAFSCLTF